ncbi:MAG: HAD-IB family hydrolase [Chloroflexi bacterium]|nr:HAD-IB family hydrolase [Chloroflexota bacterium]
MTIAFFDMDKTLLSRSSTTEYIKYLWRHQMLSVRELIAAVSVSIGYALKLLDFPRVVALLSRDFRDGDVNETRALAERWVREELLRYIAPRAVARVRAHQEAGDEVWLLSAATQFVVMPIARHLGIQCRFTELEISGNRITGNIVDAACYGAGKVVWAERIARERGVALSDCVFYTDSISDQPLLDCVGHPVAVNPDKRLERYARSRGWVVEKFY